MAKGGHARSGPAPDPNALRRDRDKSEWLVLPKDGRQGAPPQWPLPDPTTLEMELWGREWARPQAVAWEANGQELEVALFVRSVVVAEGVKATAADRNAVQRKMNDLGLTVPGLRANRWTIGDATAAPTPAKKAPRKRSASARLQVLEGGKGGATGGDDGGSA